MAYSLSNKCTKNLCKRTVLVQLISKKWSGFLRHSALLVHCIFQWVKHGAEYSFLIAKYDYSLTDSACRVTYNLSHCRTMLCISAAYAVMWCPCVCLSRS